MSWNERRARHQVQPGGFIDYLEAAAPHAHGPCTPSRSSRARSGCRPVDDRHHLTSSRSRRGAFLLMLPLVLLLRRSRAGAAPPCPPTPGTDSCLSLRGRGGRVHLGWMTLTIALRLAAALVAGAALGIDRDLRHKPAGVRTHALVSIGSALVVLAALIGGGTPESLSRVLQGPHHRHRLPRRRRDQSGHHEKEQRIEGTLRTAASIWVAAGCWRRGVRARDCWRWWRWRSPPRWSCCPGRGPFWAPFPRAAEFVKAEKESSE